MKKTISYAIALCLCAALFACGNTASEQPAQTEKAPVTTTTTTTAETTPPAETTTTTVTTTEAPETTTPEPETSVESADKSEAEDGMYPMEECIRMLIRDRLEQEVVSFEDAEHKFQYVMYFATIEDGTKISIACLERDIRDDFAARKLTSLNEYVWGERELDGTVYKELYYVPQE